MPSLMPSTTKTQLYPGWGKKKPENLQPWELKCQFGLLSAHLLPKPPAEFKMLESCTDLCM